MIIETIRKQIKKSGLSRYRISQDTGVDQATLTRLMQGKTITVETAEILLKYFRIELKPKKSKKKKAR
ncbi:helix-turn-helix domain-containing protein [Planctomycetota bacterium]